jgi:hypothetical protein
MSRSQFTALVDDLSPELVTSLVAQRDPEVRVASVEIVEHDRCGDGLASTADRLLLALDYASPGKTSPPPRLILKTRFLHPLLRFGLPAILGLSSAVRAAQSIPLLGDRARSLLFVIVGAYQKWFPHAPDAMYVNEVRFYRDLRDDLDIEAPRSFGSVYDERTRHFGMLLEDLNERDAHFPNALESQSLETMRSLLANLASLHARFWKSPRFERDLDWVDTRLAGGMFPVFDKIGLDLIRYQVAQHAFKADLIAPLGRSVDELWEALWASQRILDGGPHTLLHGDTHIGNTYVLPDASGGFLDWQLMVRGSYANDISYVIATGLDPATRRAEQRALIEFYLEELRRHGVEAPTFDEAWTGYRLGLIWGLVIGWLITPPVNYGEPITSANIARLVDAALDADSLGALRGE